MEITYLLSEIDSVAAEVLKESSSKTVLFYGGMGAGKTTLIQSMVRALGTEDTVSSPTFSIVNEYQSDQGLIYHFDFYRIEDEKEAMDFGVLEYLDSPAWKFIEWPQKISKFLDQEYQKVELLVLEKGQRMLKFC